MNKILKKELLKELKEKFEETKKNLGFKSTFEQVNSLFYLDNAILSSGFVSERFSRQLISKIIETYYSWVPLIHSWIMPPQYDLIYLNENKQLSTEEREELKRLIEKLMYFVRKDKSLMFDGIKEDGKFVDELVDFYYSDFEKKMFKYHKKFEKFWNKT